MRVGENGMVVGSLCVCIRSIVACVIFALMHHITHRFMLHVPLACLLMTLKIIERRSENQNAASFLSPDRLPPSIAMAVLAGCPVRWLHTAHTTHPLSMGRLNCAQKQSDATSSFAVSCFSDAMHAYERAIARRYSHSPRVQAVRD